MSMENQVTSIEQSQRLLELGVPSEKASMVWIYEDLYIASKVDFEAMRKAKYEPIPAFTVADLLEVLPFKIEYDGMEMFLSFDAFSAKSTKGISYKSPEYGDTISFIDYTYTYLVNSICKCIEWLDENGINLNL